MAVTKFKQIKKFCDDNGIELICVTSPITPSVMQKLGMGTVNDVLSQFLKNRMYLIIILTKPDYQFLTEVILIMEIKKVIWVENLQKNIQKY